MPSILYLTRQVRVSAGTCRYRPPWPHSFDGLPVRFAALVFEFVSLRCSGSPSYAEGKASGKIWKGRMKVSPDFPRLRQLATDAFGFGIDFSGSTDWLGPLKTG